MNDRQSESEKSSAAPAAGSDAATAPGGLSSASPAQRSFEAAYADYLKLLQQIATEMNQYVEKASLDYRRATLESWLQLNTQESLQQAFQVYQQSAVNVWSAVDGKKRADDAYRAFLRALQVAWVEADLESIDPVLLTGIANSMVAVAHYAHAQLGRQAPGA